MNVSKLPVSEKLKLVNSFLNERKRCAVNCFTDHYNKLSEPCDKCLKLLIEFENTVIVEKQINELLK